MLKVGPAFMRGMGTRAQELGRLVYAAINSIGRTAVLINPGSDRPQGPWDPDEKKKWIDTTYFWTLMPILLMMVIGITVGVYFGD